MSTLRYYCRRATETKGLQHKAVIETLRNFIKQSKPEDLIEQIKLITKQEYLRTLWEAGLTAELQKAVLRRQEEIIQGR